MSGFPLLSLPPNLTQEVLRNANFGEQIALSLCSKRCKSLVRSIDWKIRSFDVTVGDTFKITTLSFNPLTIKVLQASRIIVHERRGEKVSIENEAFGVGDWIRHIAYITNNWNIRELDIARNVISVETIKEAMKGLEWKRLRVSRREHDQHREDTLNQLLPKFQLITLGPAFNGSNKFLLHNLECLIVFHGHRIKLEHLLMANASCLILFLSNFEAQILNRFIKLFMTGSNPRLKFALFHTQNSDWNMDTVMNGVKYEKRGAKTVRKYDQFSFNFHNEEWKDAIEISRVDRTKVTISLITRGPEARFGMAVDD